MLEKVKNVKGTVFLTVLMMSAVAIFIAACLCNILLQDTHMINHLKYSMQAQYLAEAGINHALMYIDLRINGFAILGPSTFSLTPPSGSDLGGTYTVTTGKNADSSRVFLQSVGTVRGVSRTVIAEIKDLSPTAFGHTMSAGNNLRIDAAIASVALNGSIHANNRIDLQTTIASMEVTETATATNDYVYLSIWQGIWSSFPITINGTDYEPPSDWPTWTHYPETLGNDTGEEAFCAPAVTFPVLDYTYYARLAMGSDEVDTSDDDYYSGDQIFDTASDDDALSPANGIIYVEGTATFYGASTLNGGIIADAIEIKNRITGWHWVFIFYLPIIERGELNQVSSSHNRNVVISRTGDLGVEGTMTTNTALVFAGHDFESLNALCQLNIRGLFLASSNLNTLDFVAGLTYIYSPILLDRGPSDIWIEVVSWVK